jgi:predicted DNA-binding transcriptional regulator YafY
MMQIHAQLQARRFPNCNQIAGRLEVSPKTIQRDIDFMRYRLGLPIEYDARKVGFYYSEPVSSFPSIEVTEGEITALFVAQKALAQYRGTPFEKPLRTAFRKITDSLTDRVAFSWSDLEETISFHHVGVSGADLQLFETVSQAVLRQVELEFEYRKLGSKGYERRRVRPFHIASLANQWYLFAGDLARKQLRTFALPRMRKVGLTNVKFRRPANFSISRVLSGSFGVFEGGKKYRIRLRFDAFAARLVGERMWHESQRFRENKDGTATMELELGGLEEIERWVLSWGRHVKVIEPGKLARRVREEARAVARS